MKKRLLCAVFFLILVGFLGVGRHITEKTMIEETASPVTVKHLEIQESEEPIETEPLEEPEIPETPEPPENTYQEGLAAYITSVNGTVTEERAEEMVACILDYAEKYELDEKLIMAMAQTESTYYSDAVSCADYKGLMQTGDILAEEAGYEPDDLFDPEVSIAVGTDYMDAQMETFDQDMILALTAYNQGPGSVYEGDYSTAYANQTMEHMENIELFLENQGYIE